jgi:hypothetical protein
MRFFLALLALAATTGVLAQQPSGFRPQAYRIPVRHADPWAIKFLLEGRDLVSPEISTVFAFMGVPPAAGDAINGLVRNGRLIVNPIDNSLWFYPDPVGR